MSYSVYHIPYTIYSTEYIRILSIFVLSATIIGSYLGSLGGLTSSTPYRYWYWYEVPYEVVAIESKLYLASPRLAYLTSTLVSNALKSPE